MQYSYNGIEFDIIKTNVHSMEAVYSEDGADYLYTRCHVDVTAVLNPKAMSYTFGPSKASGQKAGTTLSYIRHALLQPRGQFVASDFGTVVVQSPDGNSDVDVANGPFPRRCEIQEITGSKTWFLRWSCDFAINDCTSQQSGVLSNRYTVTHSINEYHLTTRTAFGRTKFRSDVLRASGEFAHDMFNGNMIPDQLPGFQRESLDVTVDSDGLGLTWRIRDVEKMYDLGESDARLGGSGILRIEGSCGLSSWNSREGMAGGNSLAQIDVRVYGNRYANQWIMMQRCFQVVISKLALNQQNPVGFVTNASLRESLGTNEKWVEVSVTMLQSPVSGQPADSPAAIRLDPMTLDAGALFEDQSGRNPSIPNAQGTRGTAEISAMTAALKAACAQVQPTPGVGETDVVGPVPPTGPAPAITVQPAQLSDDRKNLYQGVQDNPYPYTHYEVTKQYHVLSNVLMCPTTGPPSGSGGGGSGGTGDAPSSGPGSAQWSWPAAQFQLSSPTAKVHVEFQAERVGRPPLLPTLKPNDKNMILESYRIVPHAPTPWTDGSTVLFGVHGYYVFTMNLVPQDGDSFSMGTVPWTNIAFTDAVIPPEAFSSGIYDEGKASGGGGAAGSW